MSGFKKIRSLCCEQDSVQERGVLGLYPLFDSLFARLNHPVRRQHDNSPQINKGLIKKINYL